jgi:hypothetical protein
MTTTNSITISQLQMEYMLQRNQIFNSLSPEGDRQQVERWRIMLDERPIHVGSV